MANFLAELKGRNVFKVATIYIVVSWLILQVADNVFPLFDIPIWASRLVVIFLGLGFPVAVIMAWAFDLTPDGVKWQSDIGEQHVPTHAWDWILAVLLTVAIGLMVTNQIGIWRGTDTGQVPQARSPDGDNEPNNLVSAPTNSVQNSIAVLPFKTISADSNDDYVGDGIAEELLGVLGRIPELKVASRTSTAYFKKKDIDNATIAETLNVDNILSGSVRHATGRIRVTAALDKSRTGQLLWTNTFDRTFEDLLDIQIEIAQSVAAAIVPVLSPKSETLIDARPTDNNEAYDYYLRGRDYLRQPSAVSTLASAAELFDRAIDLDPDFAQAHAGLCDANLRSYEFSRRSEYFQQAEIRCHRALLLNDSLWEVQVALGNLYSINGNYDQAVKELEAAVRKQPNAVDAYLTLASVYAAQKRLEEAEATFRRAEEVESGYWGVHRAFGHFYYDQSRYAEAIERYKKVAELAPDNSIGQDNLGNTYLAIGELDLAEQAFTDTPEKSRWTYTNRGLIYYYQGDYSNAVADQLRAIELAPDEHRAWGRLGDVYRFMPGKEEDARSAYRTAIKFAEQELEINPTFWDSVVRLGIYFVHTGRPDDARLQIDRVFELTDDNYAYYVASIVSVHLGDRELAWEYLKESVDRGFAKKLIMNDPDLAPLRSESEFDALMAVK